MAPDEAVVARLAVVESEVANMREENRALRTTLHEMIGRSLAEHSAAISRLAAAHDAKLGAWWAIVSAATVLIVLIGAAGWLIEKKISVTISP